MISLHSLYSKLTESLIACAFSIISWPNCSTPLFWACVFGAHSLNKISTLLHQSLIWMQFILLFDCMTLIFRLYCNAKIGYKVLHKGEVLVFLGWLGKVHDSYTNSLAYYNYCPFDDCPVTLIGISSFFQILPINKHSIERFCRLVNRRPPKDLLDNFW